MDGQMDEWTDRGTDGYWDIGWTDNMHSWTDGRINGLTNGDTDGQTVGEAGRQTYR
jgi:hypothetical protein